MMEVPKFEEAIENGEVIEQDSYHKPGTPVGRKRRSCGCTLTTDKGAYRDVSVEMDDGMVIHFYHQSPIVVEKGNKVRVSSCGWETPSTKERINRYIPSGHKVYQDDGDWYITREDGTNVAFHDKMVIEPIQITISK